MRFGRVRPPVGPTARLGGVAVRTLGASWRFRYAEDRADGAHPDGQLAHGVYALWHQHLLALSVLHANRGIAALASLNRDGEIISRILETWGFLAVRGSSSRRGSAGLREMIRVANAGRSIAFTPDGPRGPRHTCRPGVVKAAAATGLPIVPVGAASRWAWTVDSWDGFLVPGPFARIFVSYGRPIQVPAEAEDDLDAWTETVRRQLNEEVARCEARAGVSADAHGGMA